LPSGFVIHPRASVLVTTLGALFFSIYLWLAPPAAYTGYEDKPSFLSNVGLAFALSYILSAVAWVFSQGIGQTLGRVREQNRELAAFAQESEAQRQLRADTGKQILELAERLTQYSSRQARGANRQAAAVAQVSTSIEELTQAAREIAQNAHLVDRAAQQTLQGAREGQEVVERNSEEATGLDEHLKQVNRVATIISDVASQIQLVAFNATLEAAEAGEAGQRFGVVAGEVKDLAADSLRQAKQVAQIVRQVQEAGEAVVSLSEEQVQAVRSGSDVMERSRAANQAIIDSASRMAELAGQIQQTTAQQQQANEQVADSVQEIRMVVDRWVVSSYQMDELVATLQSLAGQLA
jgi:methyl-accepting chemotaxis protein